MVLVFNMNVREMLSFVNGCNLYTNIGNEKCTCIII